MIDFPYIKDLCHSTSSKIILLVVDGLGGLPHPDTGKSELECSVMPNFDRLVLESACGLTIPVLPGITPGSGPGHLALFGYDPVKYLMGRGVLEAVGIGVDLRRGDVAARGNLCTVGSDGLLIDRRAGRIPTEESAPLIDLLDRIQVPEVSLSVRAVRDHRFVLVMSGQDLGDQVSETDPQSTGVIPLEAKELSEESKVTARVVNAFVAAARESLSARNTANMVLLRGFSRLPQLPNMGKVYRINPVAIAAYPMYRGLAKLVGMEVLATGNDFDDQLCTLEGHFENHDFFFLHYKPPDIAGEDGDFKAKIEALEALDARIPRILNLNPDTLIIAGDHSTPAIMGSHSWHPVPFLIHSHLTLGEGCTEFSERACAAGSIGTVPATSVMTMAMAHAGKLSKFGP